MIAYSYTLFHILFIFHLTIHLGDHSILVHENKPLIDSHFAITMLQMISLLIYHFTTVNIYGKFLEMELLGQRLLQEEAADKVGS